MAAAYFEYQFTDKATFELFVRSLPPERNYLLTAGLAQALDYLENLRIQDDDIAYIRRLPAFKHVNSAFFDYLKEFRFTGEVWAMPEGTPAFAEEPLLRVTAPMMEAQIVETFLISMLTFQTMIASKASRIVTAAQGRQVVDFGSRRAHGPEAGVLAARAAYIGGCTGTSNVEAGKRYGIPALGTLAHSFIMAYTSEAEAFRKFYQLFPEYSVLLVDTYDTMTAIEKIIREGIRPRAVRLDSGDLLELSKQVRDRLDSAGLQDTWIFASGDLDEFVITRLLAQGAKIDSFGVGTALTTSKDAPALGGVYKLVDIESKDGISYRAKLSKDKSTYPGSKQVYRFYDSDGCLQRDVVACASEAFAGGNSLLSQVMKGGTRTGDDPALSEIQQRAQAQIAKIPTSHVRLQNPQPYTVTFSNCLKDLLKLVRKQLKEQKD